MGDFGELRLRGDAVAILRAVCLDSGFIFLLTLKTSNNNRVRLPDLALGQAPAKRGLWLLGVPFSTVLTVRERLKQLTIFKAKLRCHVTANCECKNIPIKGPIELDLMGCGIDSGLARKRHLA